MNRVIWISTWLGLVVSCASASAEELRDLVRQGYSLFHQECCVEFDGCDDNKAYVIGPYVAICQEYGYSYSYGDVMILARRFTYQGRQINLYYLCPDGDDECYQVNLLRR